MDEPARIFGIRYKWMMECDGDEYLRKLRLRDNDLLSMESWAAAKKTFS